MLEYCAHKYGNDKVAQIITFGTMGARGAMRDVARVMDIPIPEVDQVAKLIPNIPGKPVSLSGCAGAGARLQGRLRRPTTMVKDLIDTAIHMEGVVRNAGTHAAGVVITDKPIIEYLPTPPPHLRLGRIAHQNGHPVRNGHPRTAWACSRSISWAFPR